MMRASAIPIVGPPRLGSYDVLLWEAENEAIRSDPTWNNGDYKEQPARGSLYEFAQLLLTTPERYNASTKRSEVYVVRTETA
jgi:homoserine acetyltransferase